MVPPQLHDEPPQLHDDVKIGVDAATSATCALGSTNELEAAEAFIQSCQPASAYRSQAWHRVVWRVHERAGRGEQRRRGEGRASAWGVRR